MLYKYCSKCRKLKPVINFSKNKRNNDGYMDSCKVCENYRAKINYRKRIGLIC